MPLLESREDHSDRVDQGSKLPSGGIAPLGQAVARGGLWGGVHSIVNVAGSTITAIMVARFLGPGDFAILGIVGALIGFADRLTRFGLAEMIVIEKRDPMTTAHEVFSVTLAMALLQLLALGVGGPIWGAVYKNHMIPPVLFVASVGLCLAMLTAVPRALLERRLAFGTLNTIEMANRLIGTALIAALLAVGCRYWAVFLGGLGAGAVSAILFFAHARYRPRITSDFGRVKSQARFGLGVFLVGVLDYVGEDLDYFILGGHLPSQVFGRYYFAYSRARQPWRLLGAAVNGPVFAALAQLKDEPGRFAPAVIRAVRTTFWLFVPVGVFLALTADPLIPYVFGEQWRSTIWMCRWFFLLLIPAGLDVSAGIPLFAQGRAIRYATLSLWRVLVLAAVLLGGVVLGWPLRQFVVWIVVSMSFVRGVTAFRAYHLIGVHPGTLIQQLWPTVVSAAISGLALHFSTGHLVASPLYQLLIGLVVFALTYGLLSLLIQRSLLRDLAGLILS